MTNLISNLFFKIVMVKRFDLDQEIFSIYILKVKA